MHLKKTFEVKNTCGQMINKVGGGKDNFASIFFFDVLEGKSSVGG